VIRLLYIAPSTARVTLSIRLYHDILISAIHIHLLTPTPQQLAALQVHEVDPKSRANLPAGVDESIQHWVNLDGDGLPGVLISHHSQAARRIP